MRRADGAAAPAGGGIESRPSAAHADDRSPASEQHSATERRESQDQPPRPGSSIPVCAAWTPVAGRPARSRDGSPDRYWRRKRRSVFRCDHSKAPRRRRISASPCPCPSRLSRPWNCIRPEAAAHAGPNGWSARPACASATSGMSTPWRIDIGFARHFPAAARRRVVVTEMLVGRGACAQRRLMIPLKHRAFGAGIIFAARLADRSSSTPAIVST